jgi:hypothetical protein
MFGPGEGNAFEINSNLWQDSENVLVLENAELTKPFMEDDIKNALFEMERNKAACPDGLPIEFYQYCWDIIKYDMLALFEDFDLGNLDIKRINFGIITLLPRVKDAERIQQFRPICLLNYLYKWITKCLTLRLEPIAARIIHKSQITFIKGRNIMNSVLALHDILHETKIKRKVGVVLKFDFEKAYDKISWDFLLQCWCGWIKKVLQDGTISAKINNEVAHILQATRG